MTCKPDSASALGLFHLVCSLLHALLHQPPHRRHPNKVPVHCTALVHERIHVSNPARNASAASDKKQAEYLKVSRRKKRRTEHHTN